MSKITEVILSPLAAVTVVSVPCASLAQILPDTTLPNSSSVSSSVNSSVINGGTQRGFNLFHSFKEFNVVNGSTARFNNSATIQNIISRVTGSNISQIDGLLESNGTANLFILNPSGIVFGPNSKLNIGGSFFVTTANKLEFSGGIFFGVDDLSQSENLSSALPTNFVFNGNPAQISFEGNGGQLGFSNPAAPLTSLTIGGGNSLDGLRVNEGQGIYILGGSIDSYGGVLTAPSGIINLSSISSGKVALSRTPQGYGLSYDDISSFSNTLLDGNTLIDASGSQNGKIEVYTKNLDIKNSSKLYIQTIGDATNNGIKVFASENINIQGVIDPLFFPNPFDLRPVYGGLILQHVGDLQGPKIEVESKNISISKFGYITSSVFGNGPGGDTTINVQDLLLIDGTPIIPSTFTNSVINTFSVNGAAGNISLSGKQLKVLNGGFVTSQTTSSKPGGNLNINFSDSIDLIGSSVADIGGNSFLPSTLTSGTTGQGNSGNIQLFTKRLNILGGANINAITAAQGNGGEIRINATESLRISGESPNSPDDVTLNISGIFSSGSNINPLFISFFGPEALTGDAGRISINTGELVLDSNAQIGVLNQGAGNAGTIDVQASKISILNGASISAETFSGQGGEIAISSGLLDLRNGNLTASARQDGPGGNVTINSNLVVAIEQSNISANAQNAQGGNIKINTLGLFLSPDSTITASSQLGTQFDGSVDVEAEITDFSRDLSFNIQSEPPELYASCGPTYRDTLAYYRVGTAGQPINPATLPDQESRWMQVAKARYDQRRLTYADPRTGEHKPLKRVVGWKTNENGTVTFVNDPREADQYASEIASTLQACKPDQTAKAG